MQSDELKALLTAIGITQQQFARLLGVTPRAVSLWMVGERGIPGPVEAYAQLLHSLPPSQRQVELARIIERKSKMREGMYAVSYTAANAAGFGAGAGVLVIENGRAYGADPFGGKYDGSYVYDDTSGLADLSLKLTFPPNAPAVFGVSHPYEWSIDARGTFDARHETGSLSLQTPISHAIHVNFRFMRSLPDA